MKDHTEKYDRNQLDLLAKAQAQFNDMVMDLGRRLKPSVVKPGEDVDSHQATLVRGARALTWWKNAIREDVLNRIPDAQDILGPPAFSLICGMALGEICAMASEVGDSVPDDVEDIMADVFEGGYILGRVSLAQAIDRGSAMVEKDAKGVVKITFGAGGQAVN